MHTTLMSHPMDHDSTLDTPQSDLSSGDVHLQTFMSDRGRIRESPIDNGSKKVD